MIDPVVITTITDDEALGLIIRNGMTGYGVPATGRLCFWSAEDLEPGPGAIGRPWKLCKALLPGAQGWQVDSAWLAKTRV